jgi:hypothetical protein
MGNKQFPNEPGARKAASRRRKNAAFQIINGRIDVRTSLALDGQTENVESLETQCWRGFQGFDENRARVRATLRATSTGNFLEFVCDVFFGVVGRQNGH